MRKKILILMIVIVMTQFFQMGLVWIGDEVYILSSKKKKGIT